MCCCVIDRYENIDWLIAAKTYYGGLMGISYQIADAHFIDYRLYRLAGVKEAFRGPAVTGDRYMAFVGAAQTFGRFADKPFPSLVSRALEIEALNLGRGGSSSTFVGQNPILLELVNRAPLVVVQVLSGRSQSNSMFQILDNGMIGINLETGQPCSAPEFYTWLMDKDKELTQKIVEETRTNYIQSMTLLLNTIKPPKVLLWFSNRAPEYQERLDGTLVDLFGMFPQFVNRPMVDSLRGNADAYVECVSNRGIPQPIVDRGFYPVTFEGAPLPPSPPERVVTMNTYYPSPEMHEDAAAMLIPVCREILGSK